MAPSPTSAIPFGIESSLPFRQAIVVKAGTEILEIEGFDDIELIGSGGNAHVYRAQTIDSEEVVAIKVLRGGGDDDVARRFERERTLMSELDSIANVVPVKQSGFLDSGDPFLVMPYFEGGSLEEQVNTGPLPWREAVELTKTVAESVALAHAKRILHLDIKPANVLLDDTGKPWLGDFGIAETMGPTTSMSAKMMTPAFTPPERVSGGKPGEQTDTYAVVALLFALLSGRQPYVTEDTASMLDVARAIQTEPLALEWLGDGTPEAVRNLVARGMAKDPSDRPRSAIELVGLLEDVLAGRDIAPAVASSTANQRAETIIEPLQTSSGQANSNRVRVLVLAAIALLAVIGGGALLLNWSGGASVVAGDGQGASSANTSTEVTAPQASFSRSATVVEEGEAISFRDTSTGDVGSVEWWISDGRTATGSSISNEFPDPGTYQVEMTVTGPGGTDQAMLEVEVVGVTADADPTPRPDNIGCQYITPDDVQWVFAALPALVNTYQIEFADGDRRDIGNQPVPFTVQNGELNKIIAIGPGGVTSTTVSSCEAFGGLAPEDGDPELPTNVRCEFHDFFWTEDGNLTWSETWSWDAGAGAESFTMNIDQDGETEFESIGLDTSYTTVGVNGQPNSGRSLHAVVVVGETSERSFALGNCGVMGGTGWEVPPRPEEESS